MTWLGWEDTPVFTTVDPYHGVSHSGLHYDVRYGQPVELRCDATAGSYVCGRTRAHPGAHLPCIPEMVEQTGAIVECEWPSTQP